MPELKLKVSDELLGRWQTFLNSALGRRLQEEDLLGDWIIDGFLLNQKHFVNGPQALAPLARPDEEQADQAAQARQRLPKAQRRILPVFDENDRITAQDIARILDLRESEGLSQAEAWVAEDFLAPAPGQTEPQTPGQAAYILSPAWRNRNLSANRPSLFASRLTRVKPGSQGEGRKGFA